MATLGFIDGLGDAIVSISQALSGYYSDKWKKRKVFVWLGYLLGGIARVGYALAPVWQWLIPFRVLDRSGKMRGSPRDAILAENSTDANRGRNFGFLRMADNSGAVVGILLAMALLPVLGYRMLFLLAAIPSVLASILIIKSIRESTDNKKIYKGIMLKNISKDLRIYTFGFALFSLGSFSYSFLLVYAKQYGFAFAAVPILYLLYTVVAAAMSLPFGKLSDKIGRKKVLYMALGFWILTSAVFIYWHSVVGIVVGILFYGLHLASLEPVQKTIAAELADKNYIASSIGGFQTIIGLMALPASLIAGFLWDKFSPATPFYFSLLLTLLAILLLSFVRTNHISHSFK